MFALIVHPWPQCVVALYPSLAKADEAVRDLDLGRFPLGQVSLVSRTAEEEGLLFTGSLALAFFDSLEEPVRGAGAGGFLSGLQAWGVASKDVAAYEVLLRTGTCLVVCHGTARQVKKARRLLSATGALAVMTHDSRVGFPDKVGGASARWTGGRIKGRLVWAAGQRHPERDSSW
jgi:hypothetical protein